MDHVCTTTCCGCHQICSSASTPRSGSWVPANLPDGAATFLLAQPLPARVFAYQGWSSYLDWRLSPRYQLMVDVAFEAHPSEVWLDYMTIEAGHVSWEERLQRDGVN